MKKLVSILIMLWLGLSLAACSTGPAAGTTTTSAPAISAGAQSTLPVVASPASVQAQLDGTHEDAGDYDVDPAAATSIIFDGGTLRVSAANSGVSVSGSTVTISAPGDYRLSGTLDDGQVIISSSADGAVRLILDGVTLNNNTSAPLYIQEADKVILILADGSSNRVSDAASYTYPSADVDEPNAAIFSAADLSIGGGGALEVQGNFNDGINTKDGLIIAGGSLSITAADDGLRGKDYIVVEGGTLQVDAGGDGLKSDNEEDAARGYIAVTGGTFSITAGGDAISAQTSAAITGGSFTLTTMDGAGSLTNDYTSAKAIKAGASVTISGGTFQVNAADDAIHSNGSIAIQGGTFTLASGDDAVHADLSLTVDGGDLRVTQSTEGLESQVITINAGTLRLVASDDAVNVADGNDGSGAGFGMGGPGFGGGPGGGTSMDASAYTGANHLYIHGGYLSVEAGGDGIDVNGAIEMTGGTVLVSGPTNQGNGAVDYDGGFNLSGGLLIAAGSSGMAMTAGSYSTQNAVLVYLPTAQPAGTPVHVQDSAGTEIFTFTPAHDYQSIAFSVPGLVNGDTYIVYTGGSTTAAVTDGLAQGEGYSPGSEAIRFTISSTITTAGNGGGKGPGGPPGRRP